LVASLRRITYFGNASLVSQLRRLFLLPSAAIMIGLFLIPTLLVAVYSVLTRGAYGGVMGPFSGESYGRIFDVLYGAILLRSVLIAGVATFCCLVLAFPIAWFIARAARRKTFLLNLVMLPFWTSFLIRTYAWMFLLRDTGLINTTLLALHLIRQPLPLLFNNGAVILGLVYGYLPFMVLPLYAAMEKLDPSLIESAADLGATPLVAVWKVVMPLSRPGAIAGCLLVFIPCLGAYLTPDLMGGGKTVMLGNLVQNQFTTARDWPFGAAISLLMLALVFFVSRFLSSRSVELL
jgi:spermidine/putrescine transport system permease protein